ncbi:MAG: ABC transporter ATP-binding protein [Candidatus Jettenia sp.]|uniref:ABC transporter ATP-binding component n=1 Tax=Candidatus Jettenia caeni TaxID=247490 RepID=I3IJ78_9BACT|nr:ABC transporter ATP-binding protein [Candidatus Jettenia sp. AMX1]MBC6927505.1 ABC transporter ATP-binding protein [Candidatus Jettenia sp.]NUN22852.1 ABC transporter ATP-binding protein [Candidatus Jettenia caeni]KAA0249790.1 MAG: ABC transporter ATP-binding protein [Candidatus Jettenia sp. AMX1]MCE7879187.1 ABC transporter ATP-binding protein [Candidatus Jettenia sp. AMX1]MDL1937595.1 ABC transporter ATP-binding protein [Candidatus Jettenia sp. AMX1]
MPKVIIEFKDVYKSFNGILVHNGINLSIVEGEIMSLLGGSGSGKSVLLKELIGLVIPDRGDIIVLGNTVTQMNEESLIELREHVGMLFQGAALFDSLTVFENIAYPLREHLKLTEKEIRERVAEKLYLVGLGGIENKMPNELSGGMRKRVGLARAIATDPNIILYDEPTTGLDPITAQRINELIIDLQKKLGITSVVVTHDLHCVKTVSNRIAMLYEGKIVAVGTWNELITSDIQVVRDFISGNICE